MNDEPDAPARPPPDRKTLLSRALVRDAIAIALDAVDDPEIRADIRAAIGQFTYDTRKRVAATLMTIKPESAPPFMRNIWANLGERFHTSEEEDVEAIIDAIGALDAKEMTAVVAVWTGLWEVRH
jgi:hypothetical protein